VIECDENNHDDRDPIYEKTREDYITSLGNNFIRFNPNSSDFDLSNIIKKINKIIIN
jgi:very-short-patch-repair endonuclease